MHCPSCGSSMVLASYSAGGGEISEREFRIVTDKIWRCTCGHQIHDHHESVHESNPVKIFPIVKGKFF